MSRRRWFRSAEAERHTATVFSLAARGLSLRISKRARMLHGVGIINKTKQKPHQALLSYPFAFRNRDYFAGGTTVAPQWHGSEELTRRLFSRHSVKALITGVLPHHPPQAEYQSLQQLRLRGEFVHQQARDFRGPGRSHEGAGSPQAWMTTLQSPLKLKISKGYWNNGHSHRHPNCHPNCHLGRLRSSEQPPSLPCKKH